MGALQVVEVPLALLRLADAEDDSRGDVGDVRELAASIRELGLLQPVGVRVHADGYFQLVYGHRRVAAVSSLGWLVVPAVLLPDEPDRDLIKSLVENIQRRQLSRSERAQALERLANHGLGFKAIAQQTGLNANTVWSWLKVGRSRVLLDALSSGQIGIHQARQMASLDAAVVHELLPELEGKSEAWMQLRIARAVDDHRKTPPNGTFKKHSETHVQRSLELILEHARGIKDIRSQHEVDLLQEIIDLVGKWQRDLLRARSAPT